MRITLILLLTLLSCACIANDGSYKMSGNQLIPINNGDISILKEVLTIKRTGNDLQVTVDYTFYNHGPAKDVIVGFEAYSPEGDVTLVPAKGQHPYMHDFNVMMNNRQLSYQVAYVSDSNYRQHNAIRSRPLQEIMQEIADGDPGFFYVYHFKAPFKKGENRIIHIYTYELNSFVIHYWNFDYVLTAANRWKDGIIKDFTLILDMGDYESFQVPRSFFTDNNEWQLSGKGRLSSGYNDEAEDVKNTLQANIHTGRLIFRKQDFHPTANLHVYSARYLEHRNFRPGGSLPLNLHMEEYEYFEHPGKDAALILRNYPFARKGYVFKNPQLKAYYEKQAWYIPDPAYTGERSTLSPEELKWLDYFEAKASTH